jgi:hypothetical protein
MRHFERRLDSAFPYYKIAAWDSISLTFRDGRATFHSEGEARSKAKPGIKHRVSRVDESGRTDLEPFTI